jgi:hypothetical protein
MVHQELIELKHCMRKEHFALLRAAVCVDPEYTFAALLSELDAGLMRAWGFKNSNIIIITQKHFFFTTSCLHIVLVLGSNLDKVMSSAIEQLKTIAKLEGCIKITATAVRRGWERKYTKELGFTPVATEYEMRL